MLAYPMEHPKLQVFEVDASLEGRTHLPAKAEGSAQGADVMTGSALRQLALPCQFSSLGHKLPQA